MLTTFYSCTHILAPMSWVGALMSCANRIANNPGISMAQANTAGHTKKTVQYSILYIGYAVGELQISK